MAVFLAALAWMWSDSLRNLFTTGGFKGIAGWLSWGIILVGLRVFLLSVRLYKEVAGPWSLKARLWVLLVGAGGNLGANAVAIVAIATNLSTGRLAWSSWDTLCSWVAVVTIVVAVVMKVRFRVKTTYAVVALTIGTRAFQQACLVLSSQLVHIPAGTLLGLTGIASQQAILSFIEYRRAVQERMESRTEALLLLWADGFNVISALIPLGGWILLR
ncbi:MAG TPA: hypothetical protein VFH06_01880 [Candidatus Saccharimonadales bacterium]|nr:hypothetical protein [Candidatus Saccharimonadales bacterium]